MNYFIIFFIIVNTFFTNIFCIVKNENKEKEELLFVYEHCRHGNRAPNDKKNGLYNYKTNMDIYNIYWEKPGILTESGKLQHFFLGLRNKYKYNNFINFSRYNKNELLLRSTGIKRCGESLYYQLLGMYYQNNSNFNDNNNSKVEFNEEIFKYSMPPNIEKWSKKKEFSKLNKIIENFLKNGKIEGLDLNSFNYKKRRKFDTKIINKDFIFITQKCKNHKKYVKKQRNKFNKIIKNNFIDKYAYKLKNFINFTDENYFYKKGISKSLADHFISDYLNGRKELIKFSNETGINLDDFYENCKNVYFFFMYNINCYSKSCILSASRIINETISYFDNAISSSNINKKKGKSNNKQIKMIIDLGHDVTVNAIHILMNKAFNANYTYCNFGCNIYFELYKIKSDNKYIIKYYNNDSLILYIDYYTFKKKVMEMIWNDKDIDDFCNGDKENIFKIHEEQDITEHKKNKKKKNKNEKNYISEL